MVSLGPHWVHESNSLVSADHTLSLVPQLCQLSCGFKTFIVK